MKDFLDTEFVDDGSTLMPISLAVVREDSTLDPVAEWEHQDG